MVQNITSYQSHETIPWEDAADSLWGYQSYLVLLSSAVVLNVLCLMLLYLEPELAKNKTTHILRYVAFGDLGFAFVCLFFCGANYASRRQWAYQLGCDGQAFVVTFFTLLTAYSLCVMAYLSRKRFTDGHIDATAPLFRWHVYIVIVAGALSFLSCIWPGESELAASALFCIPPLHKPLVAFIFFGCGVGLCLGYIAYCYYGMYKIIQSASQWALQQDDMLAKTLKRNKAIAKRMGIFVAAYVLAYTPVVLSTVHIMITGYYPSAIVGFFLGVGCHLNGILNPILYVLVHKGVRKVIIARYRNIRYGSQIAPLDTSNRYSLKKKPNRGSSTNTGSSSVQATMTSEV
jgi:hypothetical protein